MRYATARYNEKKRDEAYRIYVTDALRILTGNTAQLSDQRGYITGRFCDILSNASKKPLESGEPTRMIREKIRAGKGDS